MELPELTDSEKQTLQANLGFWRITSGHMEQILEQSANLLGCPSDDVAEAFGKYPDLDHVMKFLRGFGHRKRRNNK